MEIHNIGIGFCHPTDFSICRPMGSGDHLVIIVKSRAYFTLGGKEILVMPNTVFVYKEGTPQIYRAAGEEYINDWFHFVPSAEELVYIDALGIPYDTPIPCCDISQPSMLIKHLYREKISANPHSSEAINLYFRLLMLKISECMQQNSSERLPPHYAKLSKLRADIYNTPHTEYTVKAIADMLSISQSYLQHLYKQVFGVSITSDIITARIDRAKYLLSGTDYTVTAIAKLCGYNNDVHFMRQFKNQCGVTPTEYRRQFGNSSYPFQ